MIEFKIAENEEELEKAFKVRFEVFSGDGYLDPINYPDKMERDEFDSLPTTTNFLALDGDKAIGTVRFLEPNKMIAERRGWDFGLDMEHLFDLSYYKKHEMRIGEMPRSSLLREYRGSSTMMRLWGTAMKYAQKKDIYIICAIANTNTDDVLEAKIVYHFLLQNNLIHHQIETPPKINSTKEAESEYHVFPKELVEEFGKPNSMEGKDLSGLEEPPTLSLFNRLGCKYTSKPVYYSKFDRYVLPLSLDLINGMTPVAKRYFSLGE